MNQQSDIMAEFEGTMSWSHAKNWQKLLSIIKPLQATVNCHCSYILNWIKDAESKCVRVHDPVLNASTTNEGPQVQDIPWAGIYRTSNEPKS